MPAMTESINCKLPCARIGDTMGLKGEDGVGANDYEGLLVPTRL